MHRTRLLVLTVVLLGVPGVEAMAQQTTYEEFQEYLTAREGRWIVDFTFSADWPGAGKRGDKVTGYFEFEKVADGHGAAGVFYGGNGTNRGISTYDAGARMIRELWVDSGGATGICVIAKSGQNWSSKCSGSLADGTKIEESSVLTISDGGNTHRWRGPVTVGGKATDESQDVWRRVSK